MTLADKIERGEASDAEVALAFASKVSCYGPDDCWPWNGTRNAKGYGTLSHKGKKLWAHRLSWQLANGRPVPEGMLVCHRCDNPQCVNPAHLWIGTVGDNTRDAVEKGRLTTPTQRGLPGWQATKTECSRGHPLSGDNLGTGVRGNRFCRTCQRAHQKAYDARNRGAERATKRAALVRAVEAKDG